MNHLQSQARARKAAGAQAAIPGSKSLSWVENNPRGDQPLKRWIAPDCSPGPDPIGKTTPPHHPTYTPSMSNEPTAQHTPRSPQGMGTGKEVVSRMRKEDPAPEHNIPPLHHLPSKSTLSRRGLSRMWATPTTPRSRRHSDTLTRSSAIRLRKNATSRAVTPLAGAGLGPSSRATHRK